MQNSSIQNPSKVDRARERLDQAVARLEQALKNQAAAAGAAGDKPNPEFEKELNALRDENSHLNTINETVSGRLNDAIGRLRTVLGEA